MKASIIFPVKNEGPNLRWTLDSLYSHQIQMDYEVIVVNDQSADDGCLFLEDYQALSPIKLIETNGVGAANARNIGAEHATGEFLVFCDAHLLFEDDWLDKLLVPIMAGQTDAVCPAIGSIDNDTFVGYGQSLRPNLKIKWNSELEGLTETAVLPGACLAISKSVFNQIGGFEKGFRTWGHEDVEISIRLWLFGYRCKVLPTVRVLHLFRKELPYRVSYESFHYNVVWMAYTHFNEERLAKSLKLISPAKVKDIQKEAIRNGALKHRQQTHSKRTQNDNWYFSRFRINF